MSATTGWVVLVVQFLETGVDEPVKRHERLNRAGSVTLWSVFAVYNLAVISGCPGSKTEKCSWGAVCPPGQVCHDETERCVLPGQISACMEKIDYDSCDYPGSPPYTVCRNGICIFPVCGDSIVDPMEDCDNENLGGATCESLGLGGGTLGCNADCKYDMSGCGEQMVCGDGSRQGTEVCDGEDLAGENCETQGYYGGALACLSDCSGFDTSGCSGYCGDGEINGGEVCDDENLVGETCFSLELGYGDLACMDDCSDFDTTRCWGWESISAGYEHTCAMKTDNTVWCWGSNSYGQLGNGTHSNSNTPLQVIGLEDVLGVSTGYDHSCAVKNDGTVWCWGRNDYGQLGNGTDNLSNTPVQVAGGLSDATMIACGGVHSCALNSNGGLRCWGMNSQGQLGNSSTNASNSPVIVHHMNEGVRRVSCGGAHTCAVNNDGTAWCWGSNSNGQLGNEEWGGFRTSRVQVKPDNLGSVVEISCGNVHTCASTGEGTAWCWGGNWAGQLGNATYVVENTPVQVFGLTGVTAVSGGDDHSCAVKSDGTAWCWGGNDAGQLGDGTTEYKNTPVLVSGLFNVGKISGGQIFTCGVKTDLTAWCWGWNDSGQLGDGTNEDRYTAVEVSAQ